MAAVSRPLPLPLHQRQSEDIDTGTFLHCTTSVNVCEPSNSPKKSWACIALGMNELRKIEDALILQCQDNKAAGCNRTELSIICQYCQYISCCFMVFWCSRHLIVAFVELSDSSMTRNSAHPKPCQRLPKAGRNNKNNRFNSCTQGQNLYSWKTKPRFHSRKDLQLFWI
jgi:hypothetical protein